MVSNMHRKHLAVGLSLHCCLRICCGLRICASWICPVASFEASVVHWCDKVTAGHPCKQQALALPLQAWKQLFYKL